MTLSKNSNSSHGFKNPQLFKQVKAAKPAKEAKLASLVSPATVLTVKTKDGAVKTFSVEWDMLTVSSKTKPIMEAKQAKQSYLNILAILDILALLAIRGPKSKGLSINHTDKVIPHHQGQLRVIPHQQGRLGVIPHHQGRLS